MIRTGTGGACKIVAMAAALATAVLMQPSAARAQGCARADFEAVVDEAAGALRDLNQTNKPNFQEKLRLLRDKRGWSHEQFMTEAAPFVQDDKIGELDQRSVDLLDRITSMGQEGAVAKAPDCKLLAELRGHMKSLVEAQQTKWTYMLGKIDTELTK